MCPNRRKLERTETGRGPNYKRIYTKMLQEEGAQHTGGGETEVFYLMKKPVVNAT